MTPKIGLFLLISLLLLGCQEAYTPKPKAYPRMVFPNKTYELYNNANCPYSFEVPVYSYIDKEPYLNKRDQGDHCWMDIVFEDLNAKFHLSYKTIDSPKKFIKLIEDAHKLTSKHIKKAEYIDERSIQTDRSVYGLFSDVGGNSASSMQFYLTDSTQHFLFGALYFSTTPNIDSIQPAVQFIKEDVLHLINTFEWQTPIQVNKAVVARP